MKLCKDCVFHHQATPVQHYCHHTYSAISTSMVTGVVTYLRCDTMRYRTDGYSCGSEAKLFKNEI